MTKKYWNIKTMPGEFFIGMFIVVYFLYSFVAFRNDFEEKWRSIQIGDSKGQAVEILGSRHKQQNRVQGKTLELLALEDIDEAELTYLVWEVGVNNYYVLGISDNNAVALKARTEISRVGAGS